MTVVFWTCLAIVAYGYAGYPLVIDLLARGFGRAPDPPADPAPDDWPRVSLLLAAHNEEAVLAATLRNALAMDYPADRFEVVVGSDGSSDGTARIARGFAGQGVGLLDFPDRRGKAAVLNDAIPTLRGEVVLLSDANTMIDPSAARRLARWFVRAEVTSVCGRLVLVDPGSGRNADGLYWKYETFLKVRESRLGALLGANGAIYAIRRDRYVPIPVGTVVDDFVIPLLARLRHGGAIEYDAEAVAVEETAPDVAGEFRRRRRIGAGGWQAIGLLGALLDPRRGWVALAFASHKVLRWLVPFALLGMFGANLALLGRPGWAWALAGQVGFYAASALVPARPARWLRPLRLAPLFVGMNAALLLGWWDWATGRRGGTWAPTSRPAGATEEAP